MSVNVVTVVQARTGSTRLPAKVLRPLAPGLPPPTPQTIRYLTLLERRGLR